MSRKDKEIEKELHKACDPVGYWHKEFTREMIWFAPVGLISVAGLCYLLGDYKGLLGGLLPIFILISKVLVLNNRSDK